MSRYGIVDTQTHALINVIIYDTTPSTPPPGFPAGTVAIQHDRVSMDWAYNGVTFVEPVHTPPVFAPYSTPPNVVSAAFNVQITGGDIASIGGSYNVGGAIYLGVGQYMVFLMNPQPDANYYAVVTGDAPILQMIDPQTDSFTIEAKDAAGNYVDPSSLSIQLIRIN